MLGQIKEGKSKEEIISTMRSRAGIDGRGSRNFYIDIEHFLETGRPMFPESLFDIPAFIKEEERKRIERERVEQEELRRRSKEEKKKLEAEKKRKEQADLAEKLGIKDLIAGLQTHGN